MIGSPKNKVYMAVTNDEFELPIYFVEVLQDLRELLGVTNNQLSQALHRNGAVKTKKGRIKIVSVVLDDNETEE